MTLEPDDKAKRDDQQGHSDDIDGLDEGFGRIGGLHQGVELLQFASHGGERFTVIERIDHVENKHGVGGAPLLIQQLILEQFGRRHHKDFGRGALGAESAFFGNGGKIRFFFLGWHNVFSLCGSGWLLRFFRHGFAFEIAAEGAFQEIGEGFAGHLGIVGWGADKLGIEHDPVFHHP